MNGDGPVRPPSIIERITAAARSIATVSDTPQLDAEILMAHALGISRAKLMACLRDCADAPGFVDMVARRLACEPLAYILGHWEFFSLDFKVVQPLLVPRPETEHLVEAVLEHVGDTAARVLEIGTGTGCVAVSVAVNAARAQVVATDINPAALETASENARRHHVAGRIQFKRGALYDAVPDECPFDAVCSNPPYIEEGDWASLSPVIRLHEDPRALLAGKDGLDIIRPLIAGARDFLRPGGLLAFEIGMGQDRPVESLLRNAGYGDVAFRKDLAGIDRIAIARKT